MFSRDLAEAVLGRKDVIKGFLDRKGLDGPALLKKHKAFIDGEIKKDHGGKTIGLAIFRMEGDPEVAEKPVHDKKGVDREIRRLLKVFQASPKRKAGKDAYAKALEMAQRSEALGGRFATHVNANYMGDEINTKWGGDRVVERGSWMPRAKRFKWRTYQRNGYTSSWS